MISVITPALIRNEQDFLWLDECIASVDAQPGEKEHIVVNDHSLGDLSALKDRWPGVRFFDAENEVASVSKARNQAAREARGELLLPLDADDRLPEGSLDGFRAGWLERGTAGIVYGDIEVYEEETGDSWIREAGEYNFPDLLKSAYMLVGCLHRKTDWERAGGWELEMLEDWDYWITLGEMGVCGKRIPGTLYWYRKHNQGRRHKFKSDHVVWPQAMARIKERHSRSIRGRYPVGCCGEKSASGPAPGGLTLMEGLVYMTYCGPRIGGFAVAGGVTRIRYNVVGHNGAMEIAKTGQRGVHPADVLFFRGAGGGDLYLIAEPEGVVDIQGLTVKEIKELELTRDLAHALYGQEELGRGRKTVLEYLDGGSWT